MRSKIAVLVAMFLVSLFPFLSMVSYVEADPDTIIDNTTEGFYNQSLETVLDFTNPVDETFLFPGANANPDDPTFDPVPFEPDLSSATTILGNWLNDSANLNDNWTGLQGLPSSWAVNTETAIIYEINAGAGGLNNVVASFGVDNGIFVWLNGAFQSGQVSPGTTFLGEHMVNLGNLSPGTHFLQILREDHGGITGYAVLVTGEFVSAPVLDHFKCYKAKGDTVDMIVDLDDQFGTESDVLIGKPKRFCTPVDKNGEGISHPMAHLTCYKIKGSEEAREVVIENQFGRQVLEIGKTKTLCVPSEQLDVMLKEEDSDEN